MTAPFRHEEKVSQSLLADINLERPSSPLVYGGEARLQVEFLIHPMEPSACRIRIRGRRHKPKGGTVVLRVC